MLDLSKVNKIAVTGGLASGKSVVGRFFKEFGAYVVNADEIVHQLLSPTTELGQQVIALVGPEIVDGCRIDRAKIAKKVFGHPPLLKALETLLHPAVLTEVERQYQDVQNHHLAQLFIAEIPLLFEIGAQVNFDYTIAVIADPSVCRWRFQNATGADSSEYDLRMARQLSFGDKMRQADYLIFNNGQLALLKKCVKELFEKLKRGNCKTHVG